MARNCEQPLGEEQGLQSTVSPQVAQIAKNLPVMQETQIQSLGREDPLEEEIATHSSSLAWRIPWIGGTWWATALLLLLLLLSHFSCV